MTQWEYAKLLLPFDSEITEDALIKMSKGALCYWIKKTKEKRDEARKGENEELKREYNKLIEEQKDDLLRVAGEMTTLTKKGRYEYKGPCPMCGGNDRFIVNVRSTPWWFCRGGKNHAGCNEGGDTVALVAKKNGLTMWEAAEELAGYSPRDRAKIVRQRTYTKTTVLAAPPSPAIDFTAKFNRCRQLFADTSLTAFAYFDQRGLTRETVLKNRVGMAQTRRGLAIAYPCERFNDDAVWQITAYNRRYLDREKIEARIEKARAEARTEEEALYAAKKIRRDNPKTKLIKEGRWGVYRLRRIRGALCLIVVEGEENALCVWQVIRANKWLADVASVGSQSNFKSLKNDIMAMQRDYEHFVIWADEKRIADQALDLYDCNCACAIYSPQLAASEKALDANDLLKRGELTQVLYRYLSFLSASICDTHQQILASSQNTPHPSQDALQRQPVWCEIFDGPRPSAPPPPPSPLLDDAILTEASELVTQLNTEEQLLYYLPIEQAYINNNASAALAKLNELRTLIEWQSLSEEQRMTEMREQHATYS